MLVDLNLQPYQVLRSPERTPRVTRTALRPLLRTGLTTVLRLRLHDLKWPSIYFTNPNAMPTAQDTLNFHPADGALAVAVEQGARCPLIEVTVAFDPAFHRNRPGDMSLRGLVFQRLGDFVMRVPTLQRLHLRCAMRSRRGALVARHPLGPTKLAPTRSFTHACGPFVTSIPSPFPHSSQWLLFKGGRATEQP